MSIETQLGDVHQLITVDGKVFTIPDEFEMVYKAYGNYGAPPTEWITRRGYKQHGVTEVDFLVSPRTVSVQLFQTTPCDRESYWQNRHDLHEILRPNRGGALTYVIRQAGGAKRALMVRANPGAVFAPQADNNSWVIDEPIDFIAFDPIWFDPDTVSADISLTVDSSLIFPITFPITFGLNGAQFIYPITYTGSWKSYPTLTLTGPYTSAIIENLTTGISIELLQGISEGETRIITLTPGAQSIKDAAGVNYFADLAPGANLVGFAIEPDPIAPNGIQTIRAVLQGAKVYTGTGWKVQSQIDAPDRWYRLSDSTTTAQDVGADNAAGVYNGGYTQGVAGAIALDPDTAVTLNGTTGAIVVPSVEIQGISYTLSGWMKVASVANSPALIAFAGGASSYQILIFQVTTLAALRANFSGGVTFDSANGAFTLNQYNMMSLAYDHPTGQLRGLLNGVQVFSGTASDFAAPAPTTWLGAYSGGFFFTPGQIDEIKIWRGRSLSNAELKAEYDSRLIASRTYTPSGFHIDFNNRYFAI